MKRRMLFFCLLTTTVPFAYGASVVSTKTALNKGAFVASYKFLDKQRGFSVTGLGIDRTGHSDAICMQHTQALINEIGKKSPATAYVIKPQYLCKPFVSGEDSPITQFAASPEFGKLSADQKFQMLPSITEQALVRIHWALDSIKNKLQRLMPPKQQDLIIWSYAALVAQELKESDGLSHWREKLTAELASFPGMDPSPEYQRATKGIEALSKLQSALPDKTDAATLYKFIKACVFLRPLCQKFVDSTEAILSGLDNLRTIESVFSAQDKGFKEVFILGTHEQTKTFKEHMNELEHSCDYDTHLEQNAAGSPLCLEKLNTLLGRNLVVQPVPIFCKTATTDTCKTQC